MVHLFLLLASSTRRYKRVLDGLIMGVGSVYGLLVMMTEVGYFQSLIISLLSNGNFFQK
ncbi:MAG: hypothetical protein ACPGRW_07850 [Flavobacteriaceae bacterium]